MRLLRALFAVGLLLATQALASVGCICAHEREGTAEPAAPACAACAHTHRHGGMGGTASREAPAKPRTDGPSPRDDGTCDCGRGQPLLATESWDPPTDAHVVAWTPAHGIVLSSAFASLPLAAAVGPPARAPGDPPDCPCSAHPESLPVLRI